MQPRLFSALRVVPVPGTPLYDDAARGRFDVLTEHEILGELRELVARAMKHVHNLLRAGALLCMAGGATAAIAAGDAIPIVVPRNASPSEELAARELAHYIARLFPADTFPVLRNADHAPRRILLGTPASAPELMAKIDGKLLAQPESYVVTATDTNDTDRRDGLILGADPPGVLHGVYGLLERLGYGFYLSFETAPPPLDRPFSFAEWSLSNRPLSATRLVFNWHNFLSGCTGWNREHWHRWISGAQKTGFNTVMVHAYGNNPMFTFSFDGFTKPVGYIATSRRGRDWGNEHINDVRRMPGGEIFDDAEFGADAALVPDEKRAEAAQHMMQDAFAYAESRGVAVCFALDVDTTSVLPQDMITSLPENARFNTGHVWLPRPDTEAGYRFYKAQVDALFDLYPQIDILALWRRATAQEWGRLDKPERLPASWRTEYETHITNRPAAGRLPQAVCSFALDKVVDAFRRALDERGRRDVRLAMGSWGHGWVPALVEFLPQAVTLMPLDSDCMPRYRSGSFFDNAAAYDALDTARGRILPIIWAHHDDGYYIGRPIKPHARFADTLQRLDARGYGIIHWMTRPLDVYFKNHENQVWAATRNQSATDTCRAMAANCFGPNCRESLGAYLLKWWTDAPIFGRVTTDHFFHGNEAIPDPKSAIAHSHDRLAALTAVDTAMMTDAQRERLDYFRALEQLIVSFCDVQELALRPAANAIAAGDFTAARKLLQNADPAETVRRFAHLSRLAGGDRGEAAMVLSLGTRWVTDYLAARQAAGLDAVRIRYAPTAFEPLAQGGGRYTLHVDAEGKYWSVRGERETGQTVTPDGLRIDAPTTLSISPIVDTQKRLAPGRYELVLRARAVGHRGALDVHVDSARPETVRYTFPPTRGQALRLVCRGNNQNAWNSIREISCAALLRTGATADRAVDGYGPEKATDGAYDTRWAAEGRGRWIQVRLNDNVTFDRLDITWYEGALRAYDFGLLVSPDGQSWSEVTGHPEAAAITRGAATVELGETPVDVTVPVQLDQPGTLRIALIPTNGNACVQQAVLTPRAGVPSTDD